MAPARQPLASPSRPAASVRAPLAAANSPFLKVVMGVSFGVALTLVVSMPPLMRRRTSFQTMAGHLQASGLVLAMLIGARLL